MMRRARIKAVATVPVRRKTTQDLTSTEVSNHSAPDDTQKIHTEESKEFMQKSVEDDIGNGIIEQDLENGKEQLEKETSTLSNIVNKGNADVAKDIKNQCSNNVVHKNAEPSDNTNNTVETGIVSPTKSVQARSCFTRPTPRLDGGGRIRRNSVQGSGASASESEDDSKRTTSVVSNRIRNDSVCSVQSNKEIAGNVNRNYVKSRGGQKRRMLISESARKLAEARREFLIKHQNKTPDRSKLTMYDLIYYNPVTNPMKRANQSKIAVPTATTTVTTTTNTTNSIRSESREENEEEEEEDDPLPVPRVKVGPDGQLIADEQSFVIAQTDRENRKEESIVEDDNTGSGFYTKRQKSKDWPKWETMKFYKALNTVGTDFLLMQSLFPNRSREEIKIKYKKEERTNRKLVEKALTYHQDFDIETLKKELATFELLEEEETVSEKMQRQAESKDGKKRIRKRGAAGSINQSGVLSDKQTREVMILREVNAEMNNDNRYQKKLKRRKDDDDTDDEDSEDKADDLEVNEVDNDSGSDTEIYHVRPTRSGRLPKVRKLQGPEINSLDNMAEDNSPINCKIEKPETANKEILSTHECLAPRDIPDNNLESRTDDLNEGASVPNLVRAKPGSIVILSEKLPEDPGKTLLQLYMVDPEGLDSYPEA